jgi:hypothetical protein
MRVGVALLLFATAASAQPGPDASVEPAAGPASDAAAPAGEPPVDPAASARPVAPPNEAAPLVHNLRPPPPEPQPILLPCFPLYAEGNLLVGGRSGPAEVIEVVITRWSLGARLCTNRRIDIQAGLVLDHGIDTSDAHDRYSAFGAEARVMFPLHEDVRLGPHLAITKIDDQHNTENPAIWVGGRLESGPIVFGFDVLRIPTGTPPTIPYSNRVYDVWGFYGSVGLRGGWVGVIGFAAVTFIYVGNFLLNEHGS